MITIQKSAGVFGDSYEFPHLRGTLRRCYPTSTIYPRVDNILQFPTPTLQYPTEMRVTLRSTSWANPKTEKKTPIQFSFYCTPIGFPTRNNCYATQ